MISMDFWKTAISRISFVFVIALFTAILPDTLFEASYAQQSKEQGWTSLFNGKDLTGWVIPAKGSWKVENGEIVVTWNASKQGGAWMVTKETYEDFILKIKFWINKGGNSGICIRDQLKGEKDPAISGYEVQIDYNDVKNPTGSLYNLARAYLDMGKGTISKEEEWNQFEISAIGDHITVLLNGSKVAERFDRRSLKGVIGMQLHDSKSTAKFKDIEIKRLTPKLPLGPTMEEQMQSAPGEFVKLFNGKNLDGWRILWGGEWKAQDGMIHVTINGKMGWLMTFKEYSNFIYRAKVKMAKGGNSGLAIRYPFPTKKEDQTFEAMKNNKSLDPAFGGYEIQVLDYGVPEILNDAGSIYDISRAPFGAFKSSEWNDYVIYAFGNHIAAYINGKKVSEAIDSRSAKGNVGLQAHYIAEELKDAKFTIEPYQVWFKDVEIKEVK